MHIYVKKKVEGESIPGIIRNGGYHLSQFGIYEDGTVSCCQRNDLAQFRKSLEKRWVVTSVPAGEKLSVFQLGYFEVLSAEWLYDNKKYYDHILGIIKKLNPEMANIYTETPLITQKWEKARVRFSDNPIPCRITENIGYRMTDGQSTFVFYNGDSGTELTFLVGYADKKFRLGVLPDTDLTYEEIEGLFRNKTLSTSPDPDKWVKIEHLGKARLRASVKPVSADQKLSELRERVLRLAGEPTAHDKCIRAYHDYLENPNERTLEALRIAYEAVPEHERCYLGDMDTQDFDYRRILFEPENKREV